MTVTQYNFLFQFLIGLSMVESDTLQMAHVLYRHGARSPTRFFPTNPNQIGAWPDGTGRLTQKGMMLEYNLGRFLKERYVVSKFINQSYLHKEVYIRSSSIDRCLQSAEAQLTGLYPPDDWQIWKKGLNWQPIPVHTVPEDEDSLLRPDDNCPRISEIWSKMVQSDEIKQKTEENKELLHYMTENSGENITLWNLWDITDDILCEQYERMKSADWVMKRFPEILNLSNYAFNYLYQGNDELGRLLGGDLLGNMVKKMEVLIKGDVKTHKLNIFSGHDTSVLAFSTALNIKFQIPSFSACVIVELHKTDENAYYVTINYRNGLDNATTITPMSLPGCLYKCPLEDFVKLTSKRIPTNRHKECRLKKRLFTKKNLKYLAASLLALTIFLAFIFLWLILRSKCRKNWIQRMKLKESEERKLPGKYDSEESGDESSPLVV